MSVAVTVTMVASVSQNVIVVALVAMIWMCLTSCAKNALVWLHAS